MIYALLILIAVIIVLCIVVYFILKRSKSLRQRLENAEMEIKQIEENARNYKKIITKVNKKDVESEALKDNIDYAYGSDLALLANSL